MYEINPPTKQVFSSVARCVWFLRAFVAASNKLTVRLSNLSDSAVVYMQCILSHADIVCNYMLMISIGSVWLFLLAWSCLQVENHHRGSVVSFFPQKKLCLTNSGAQKVNISFVCSSVRIRKNRDQRPCSFFVYWWNYKMWGRKIEMAVFTVHSYKSHISLTVCFLYGSF